MNLHPLIISALKEMGYPAPSLKGVCTGLGGMARQSILTDDINSFNHFVDMFNPNSTTSRLSTYEMQAWLDGVYLYHHASQQHRITHIHSWYDFKAIAALNASEKLEAKGGLIQLAEFKENYTLDSLIESFQALKQTASLQKSDAPLTLDMVCNRHLITVAFDPCTEEWIYSDANALPIQRIKNDETFALEVMSSFISDENRQKIHQHILRNRDNYTLEFKIFAYSTVLTQENSRHWIVSWIKARKLSAHSHSLVPTEEMEALVVSVHDATIAKEALSTLGRAYPRLHRMFLRAIENNNTHAIEAMCNAKLLSERQLEEGLFHAIKQAAFEPQKLLLKAVNYDTLPLSLLFLKTFQYRAHNVLEVILSSSTISAFEINFLIYISYYLDESFAIKTLFLHAALSFEKKSWFC